MMDSVTQQQELFAILSGTDTSGDLLVTSTVPAVGLFGWTPLVAVAQNYTSQGVNTTTGAVTTVHTVTMFPSHVSLTRLKQLLCLEEEIHGLDVLRCFMLISGEPFVMTNSLTQQQELFATLLDSDISEERWTLTSMVWVTG